MENANVSLLTILSTEIARDGGASLVIFLKDYVSNPKQLDCLVKQAIGSTKLLSFLETNQHIFDVNRNDVPHFVKLISQEYCQNQSTSNMIDYQKNMLRDKVMYVLRRRTAKLCRRNLSKDFPTVNLSWLSKECTVRLHFFLRVSEFYCKCYKTYNDVLIVGSPLWHGLVQGEFESFLKEFLDVKDGKVYLQLQQSDENFDVNMLSKILTELVHRDGGTQVSLSLLLHRNPKLKRLLGGRDFVTIARDNPAAFSQIIIKPYETDIELQSKHPFIDQQLSAIPIGRMAVDHEGLFSVASSKWGTAMANIMVWACRETLGDPDHVTVLDLTASIGGHALALAKTSFKRIIAIEIDSHRASLCQYNMEKHRMDHKVQVRNEDAILLLPKLAEELSDQSKVVVIDPPWGGIHYKRELTRQEQQLYMGQWTLDHVLKIVAYRLSPTIVGLRLPINFVVSVLESTLRELELNFSVWNIRKLGPQLFVILVFNSNPKEE
jgi:16S rRNA G966 N2-methylase RsmD